MNHLKRVPVGVKGIGNSWKATSQDSGNADVRITIYSQISAPTIVRE